jgi:hypothetical protein
VHERVRVAMSETEFRFEHVTDLAVFGHPAVLHDGGQFVERFACLLLDIVNLGLYGLIETAHGKLLVKWIKLT